MNKVNIKNVHPNIFLIYSSSCPPTFLLCHHFTSWHKTKHVPFECSERIHFIDKVADKNESSVSLP